MEEEENIDDLTEEQIKELQTKAQKVEELEKTIGDKETEWEEERQRLEKEKNPNWGKVRGQMDKMREELEKKGFKFDEDGNATPPDQKLDIEEVKKQAREEAMNTILDNRVGERLNDYDEESGKIIKHYYGKLTADEMVTLSSVDKFFNQAIKVAEIESDKELQKTDEAIRRGATGGPKDNSSSKDKLEDSVAKGLGSAMNLEFAKEEKK